MLAEYIPLAVVTATAAVGYGELKANVRTINRSAYASRDLVDAHYTEIIRRLDRIEDRVNREGG